MMRRLYDIYRHPWVELFFLTVGLLAVVQGTWAALDGQYAKGAYYMCVAIFLHSKFDAPNIDVIVRREDQSQ